MNNKIVLFVRGPQSSLDNCPFREGQIIITNEGELYIDLPTVGRSKIQTIPYHTT